MKRPSSDQALRILGTSLLVGMASVPLFAIHASETRSIWAVISTGILIAGAACFTGGALGFLFGIPRTLQQDEGVPEPTSGEAPSGPLVRYRANTNLEQISDWLTKILVGVGLTQIGEIRQGVGSLTAFAGGAFGGESHHEVFSFALICFFSIVGFLFGYLWTRLFMASAMREADSASIVRLVDKVEQMSQKVDSTQARLDELKRQSLLDAEALSLTHRVLNPSADLPPVQQAELDQAVSKASQALRVQIFNQAWGLRAESWREDKEKMERVIPIFRALIHSDSQGIYHRNHGQLGYALKDMRNPDLHGALNELNQAIEIRGPWQKEGWLFYELNRAMCRIGLDPAFKSRKRSDPETRDLIVQDLAAAINAKPLDRIVRTEELIQDWMKLNGLAREDLRG